MSSTPPEPVLIDSNAATCTHFFSFHTPLVCEQPVSMFVFVRCQSGRTRRISSQNEANLRGKNYTLTFSFLFPSSGEVFGQERFCSHRPDTSDSRQWILHSNRYVLQCASCRVTSPLGHDVRPCLLFRSSTWVLSDEAVGQSDGSPNFYINICQPLNPIPGVICPPGAAVCMAPDSLPPVVRLMDTVRGKADL